MAKPTKPDLWRRIVAKYKASSKGSKPGQWSARSAQLASQEYREKGGSWSSDGKKKPEESLSKWGREKWRTKDGSKARKADGSTSRYLPDKAWSKMSESEKEATDRKKRSARGKQYVANTKKAKRARK